MKTKKLLSLLTAAALSISSFAALTITASAADLTDLTPIPISASPLSASTYNTIAASTITSDGYFIASKDGAEYKSNGNSTKIDGTVEYGWRVKGSAYQDNFSKAGRAFAFKVAEDCKVTIYANKHTTRTFYVWVGNGGANEYVSSEGGEYEDDNNSYESVTVNCKANDYVFVGGDGGSEMCVARIELSEPSTEKTYDVNTHATNGTLTATPKAAAAEETVTLKAKPTYGYEFSSITSNDVELNDNGDGTYTFTMPSNDVSISAEFTAITADVVPVPSNIDQIKPYEANTTTMKAGNNCKTDSRYLFVDGVDATAKSLFTDPDNGAIVDPTMIANYLNWIGGTGDEKHTADTIHPTFTIDSLPAGSYKLYYLGQNSDHPMTAAINGGTPITASAGVDFAKGASKTLKLYTIDFTLSEPISNATVVLNTDQQWLPDMYAVVIAGTSVKPSPVILTTGGTNITEYGSDAASIWSGTIKGTGATYSKITATVTLNKADDKGNTEASKTAEGLTEITTEGDVTVYIAVNKVIEDIKTVTLTVD